MRFSPMNINVFFFAWILNSINAFDSFSGLISTNVSMAVVIEKNLFNNKTEYNYITRNIHNFIMNIINKEIHSTDINLRVFYGIKLETIKDLIKNYIVLLSLATCQQTWNLHGEALKNEIVHLAITDQDCPRLSEGVSIPLIPSGKELSQIFFDIRTIDALLWNNVNILHDDTFDRDTINRVTKAISISLPNKRFNLVSRALFTFKEADSVHNKRYYIKETLKNFHVDQLGKCFLIIVTIDTASDVMEIANKLNMVQPNSQWLYIITDTVIKKSKNITSFIKLLSEGSNVAFIYNATDSNSYCNNNLMCYIQELIIALTNALKLSLNTEIKLYNHMSDEELKLIRLNKQKRCQEILKFIKTKLYEDSFVSGGLCGKCLFWRFSSAITWGNFFIRKNTAHLIDSGYWLSSLGVNLTDVIFPHIAHGFRGINLPIATYHNPPWQIISLTNSGKKEYGGLIFDIIRYLGKKMNFTYSVLSPMSNRTMKFTQNETETDMILMSTTREMPLEIIDMIVQKKVLLAACAYTVNNYAKNKINFTLPIFIQTYSFLTATPGQLSRALLFTAPFSKETWACLITSITLMGPILYLIHKYSPCSKKTSGLNSSWQCVWYVYGALLQQGGMYSPYSNSARLLVSIWWLIVMVLIATYSGSLVAFLTFPNMDTPILTVDALLANKHRLTWGFLNGSYLQEYLTNAEEEKYHVLLNQAIIYNMTQEKEIIEKVKAGNHALIDWRSTLRFFIRRDMLISGKCAFSLSTDEFMDEPIAMIIAQDSPYIDIINTELHRIHESGLMNKWISEQIPSKDKCSDVSENQDVNERKVSMADMQGIFFVLSMGMIGSIFLFCCEFYWHKRQVAKRNKLVQPFTS